MNQLQLASILSVLMLVVPGCGAGGDEIDGDSEDVAESHGALCADNTIMPNTIMPNTIMPNAIAPGMLAPNAISPSAIASSTLAVLQSDTLDGQSSRQLMKYTVSCALEPSQSFAFTWTDSGGTVHNEQYSGHLGLAPGWATAPLTDDTEQRLVSACLAARTNWYGVPVVISLRSRLDPLRTAVQSWELDAYTKLEGAFWGNLFTSSPYLNACYYEPNIDLARAANRDCAAGHLDANGQVVECGIIDILGPCNDWCFNLDQHERWYHDCTDPDTPGSPSTGAVIAVALP
jgi:hypothetical protein